MKSDENGGDRSHGIGGFRGRGYARGQGGRGVDQRQSKSSIECYYCNRYGHVEAKCWDKQRDEQGEQKETLLKRLKKKRASSSKLCSC